MSRRSSSRAPRIVRTCFIAIGAGALLFVACSDKAFLPSDNAGRRSYTNEEYEAACNQAQSAPPQPGGDHFSELYEDIFSIRGIAGCQTETCHGNATGPGGNGMAMYPNTPSPALSPKGADPKKGADDRALYCGITTHAVQGFGACLGEHKVAKLCRGTDCTCRIGDKCMCNLGPKKGTECCNPADDKDGSCIGRADACDRFCPRPLVQPHPDPAHPDSRADSVILCVLTPDKDGEAHMPQLLPCKGNRALLPVELARIESWLKRGAPYDGTEEHPLVQDAYECPPPK
jgi:hypothetical protein